jgi:ribosomal protein S27AE
MAADLTIPRSPHRLPALVRARLAVALAAGSLAGAASRLAGRGSGASIRGQIMMKVAPDALANLLPGHTIATVSGTNGKTTTTHLLAAAVRAAIGDNRVVTNADGANLHYGIASALAVAPGRDVAILETDERVVPDVVRLGRPAVLVLLNFSRDQMDRNHEIKSLGRGWRDALESAGADGPVVIANADDPLVTWAARSAPKVVWVDTATSWTQDASLCPECGTMLTRTNGRWACPTGDLVQPEATWRVDGDAVVDPDGPAGPWTSRSPARSTCRTARALSQRLPSWASIPRRRSAGCVRSRRRPAGTRRRTSAPPPRASCSPRTRPDGPRPSLSPRRRPSSSPSTPPLPTEEM